eukprot:m.26052 g.26052  ORF g.26052 m.26052 type:complete len:378 (+) comp6268_c0_seq1:104-1237(+)
MALRVCAPVQHAWNKERALVAVSPTDHTVEIRRHSGEGHCPLVATLDRHTRRVTGIDWSPTTNRIVTVGEDRTAYVWELDRCTAEWRSTLVPIRINRAATCVQWSPDGSKFAVGTGSCRVSVAFYYADCDFWGVKQLGAKHFGRPIRSTVLCVDWHPAGALLAVGTAAYSCRVVSGYIKLVEPKPKSTCWGKKMNFGAIMAEFGTAVGSGGWVHAVSFSSSGDRLVFAAHDASVTVVDGTAGRLHVVPLRLPTLPMLCVRWVTESAFVASGHSNTLTLFRFDGTRIEAVGPLRRQQPKGSIDEADSTESVQSLAAQAGRGDSTVSEPDIESTVAHFSAFAEPHDKTGSLTVLSTLQHNGTVTLWDDWPAAGELDTSM